MKNVLFISLLILSVAIAGCGGGGDTAVVTAGGAVARAGGNVTLGGTVTLAAGALAAPGRNLQITAADLTCAAVNLDTGADIATGTVSNTGAFSVVMPVTDDIRTVLKIRKGNKGFMSRYLGKVKKPSGDKAITAVKIDKNTTAKAMVVAEAKKANTAATTKLLDTAFDPDSLAGVLTTTPVDSVTNNVAATSIATYEKKCEALFTAITTNYAKFDTYVDEELDDPAEFEDAITDMLGDLDTNNDAALATALKALNLGSLTVDGSALDFDTLDENADFSTYAFDDGIDTWSDTSLDFTALDNYPEITMITIDGQTAFADGVAYDVTASTTPEFEITFSKTVTAGYHATVVCDVTETVNGTEKVETVYYGMASGDLAWSSVFTATPEVLHMTPSDTFTFSVSDRSPLSLQTGATYRIDLVDFMDFYHSTSDYDLWYPEVLSSTFTVQ
jgi:hypothetical protein